MFSDESAPAAHASPSQGFTNTFVLSSTSNSEQVLSEVPKGFIIDPFRQRRPHQKSRTGCENCRRRRVKCNEEIPCANCARRRERCQRSVGSNGVISIPSMPAQTLLPSSAPQDSVVSLLEPETISPFPNMHVPDAPFPTADLGPCAPAVLPVRDFDECHPRRRCTASCNPSARRREIPDMADMDVE
ncbi:hypothetical protein V1515DRAFT_585249 [Lipomyces mesembrius]